MSQQEVKKQSEEPQNEDSINLLQSLIEKRIKERQDKAKIWRQLLLEHKEEIMKALQQGATKADIHYALNEIVKRKYGKAYMVKANYFYVLFKEVFGSIPKSPKKTEKPAPVEKEKSTSQKNPSPGSEEAEKQSDLDKFNSGGLL
jgi:hypothetical protein